MVFVRLDSYFFIFQYLGAHGSYCARKSTFWYRQLFIILFVGTDEEHDYIFFNMSFYCTTSLITDYKYTYVTINGL